MCVTVGSLRRNQSAVRRVPAPEAVTGQFGATPPAVDRIVPAEIFVSRQDSFAERGELQLAAFVSIEALGVLVHLVRERALIEASDGGCRTMSEPVQQGSDFPVAEHTEFVGLPVTGKDIKR